MVDDNKSLLYILRYHNENLVKDQVSWEIWNQVYVQVFHEVWNQASDQVRLLIKDQICRNLKDG